MIIAPLILAAGLLATPAKANELHDPFGIAWGFLYGYEGAPSPKYMPTLRSTGGSWTKLYLFWNQLEPKKGEYDWRALDAFLGQIRKPDEALLSIFSASTWATRTSAVALPPSPAKEPKDYDRFVRAIVSHCHGKVRYFQNDSEPNDPIYWSGTASEFATETKMFSKAVRETDPKALVVLGGYDGLFNPGPGLKFPTQEASLAFFRTVLNEAPNTFDLFDLRLYADPNTIPARVEYIRKMIAEYGPEKPIVCTEYNGPGFFGLPENRQYIPLVVKWSAAIAGQTKDSSGGGVADLYRDAKTLAPQTQMFLLGCDAGLDAKLRRMQCRDLVERNLLALSAGVQRTMFWDFWHDTSYRNDVMALMYGKLKMFEYAKGQFEARQPLANAFLQMVKALKGVKSVRQIPLSASPSIMLFEADCGRRGRVLVAWERGNPFFEEPADTPLQQPWNRAQAYAQDALGGTVPVTVQQNQVSLQIGATPVFILERRF